MLSDIQAHFATKESRFWNSDLPIVEIGAVSRWRSGPGPKPPIPRRFCSGNALVSDGRWRPVHYSIIEDGGTIGASWGVEWCVVGLDRNWAYNPAARWRGPEWPERLAKSLIEPAKHRTS